MFNPRVLELKEEDEAKSILEEIGVHPGGTDVLASKAIFRVMKLHGVGYREANIAKQEMLAAGGDAATASGVVDFSKEESEIILLGTQQHYGRFVEKMKRQPFRCREFAQEVDETLKNYVSSDHTLRFPQGEVRLDRTMVMGVLNVTPDSFSDGGLYLHPEMAVERTRQMVREGADFIDVGGESTRPFSEPITQEEEWKRVEPVLKGIATEVKVPVSIDTYKPEIAARALDMGASMVNDITGLRNEEMARVVARHDVPVVIMHMKGEPRTMQENPQYDDVVSEILSFLRERMESAKRLGVKSNNIVIDPGIGFGKTVEQNLEILRRLGEFRSLGRPILVGSSRKSFIGKIMGTEVDERLEGSLAAAVVGAMNGAKIVRAHDVKETVRAVRVLDAIVKGKT